MLVRIQCRQKANLRVLRIFILASCTTVSSTCQGANSCQTFPDVESPAVGAWNDTVLQRVDDLMLRATQYGVKLTIALHDRWSLGCWRYDACACSRLVADAGKFQT